MVHVTRLLKAVFFVLYFILSQGCRFVPYTFSETSRHRWYLWIQKLLSRVWRLDSAPYLSVAEGWRVLPKFRESVSQWVRVCDMSLLGETFRHSFFTGLYMILIHLFLMVFTGNKHIANPDALLVVGPGGSPNTYEPRKIPPTFPYIDC